MRGQWAPFAESWRITALRTGSLAVAIGMGVGLYQRQLAVVPLVTVLALWFTLGGHFLEVLFRNQLGRRIGGQPRQSVARLAYWFAGGSVLYAGALATLALLTGRRPGPWPWWAGGVGFVVAELLIHQLLRARGHASFYNGLG
jgi:hypothetical protein